MTLVEPRLRPPLHAFVALAWLTGVGAVPSPRVHAATAYPAAGFVFAGARVMDARHPSQALDVSERVSMPLLKHRFPGHTIESVEGDCGGTCFRVSSRTGSFQVDAGGTGSFRFIRISSSARSSRDSLGTRIGTPLANVIGGDVADCQDGEEITCASTRIRGLSYTAGRCPLNRTPDGRRYAIPACATVDGFVISRSSAASK